MNGWIRALGAFALSACVPGAAFGRSDTQSEREPPGGWAAWWARADAACANAARGDGEGGVAEFVALRREVVGIAHRYYLENQIEAAALRSPRARAAAAAQRDTVETILRTDARTFDDLRDWLWLNRVCVDPERTLAWFDRNKETEEGRATIRFATAQRSLAGDLAVLLESRERFADVSTLYDDPKETIRRIAAVLQVYRMIESEEGQQLAHRLRAMRADAVRERDRVALAFRERAGRVYAGMLAGGRERDAELAAEEAMKQDDTAALLTMLVDTAVRWGQPRPVHTEWLQQAKAAGQAVEDVESRLQRGLSRERQRPEPDPR